MTALRPVHLQRVRSLLDQVRQCQRRLARLGEDEPETLPRSYAPFLITAEGVRAAPPIREGASGWDDDATSPGVPMAPPQAGFHEREFRRVSTSQQRAPSGRGWDVDPDAVDSGLYHRSLRTPAGRPAVPESAGHGARRPVAAASSPPRLRGLSANDDDDVRTGNYPTFGSAFRRRAPTAPAPAAPRDDRWANPATAAPTHAPRAVESDDEQTYVHSLAELRALLGGGG